MILSSVREVFDSACLLLRARAIALRPAILEPLELLIEDVVTRRPLDSWLFILHTSIILQSSCPLQDCIFHA